ncbi:MAG TPA: HAD family hydrolase [Gemmataceae bacterium]|nr:HAD family hydrolase [Gemmataceae bacterium]
MIRRVFCLMLLAFPLALSAAPENVPARIATQGDPLPSWNDGPNKKAILDFVKAATDKNGPDYIPPAERIVTFDNDGTLWCEKPTVEIEFALTRLKEMSEKDATLKTKQPFKAALEGDFDYIAKAGEKAIVEVLIATHCDMSQQQYAEDVRNFLHTAKHPKFNKPYVACVYQPMIELLSYMRANGFQTWICSGGDIDFMRVFAETVYGVPPQQVIGTTFKKEFVVKDGKEVIWRFAVLVRVNDKVGKPIGIDLQIGKRPVMAAGNVRSGGDIAMLEYCQQRKGKSLQLMVNHDDAVREFAYAEKDGESLAASKKNGWNVVSMKNDWKQIFAFEGPAKKLPVEMVGKWVVMGGSHDGAIFDFAADGTLEARFNIGGQMSVLKGTVAVQDKKLIVTTQNPQTKQDESKSCVIRELTQQSLVVEIDDGEVFKMIRAK